MAKPGLAQLISVEDAIGILDSVPVHPRQVQCGLDEALELRLAQNIVSDGDYPPFDKSLLDGYAVRQADIVRTPVDLNVVDTVLAGLVGKRSLGPGEAIAIMTGAPLPAGADTVVQVEDTNRTGGRVMLNKSAKLGNGIARRGSDVSAGRTVLTHGTRLGPAQIAVAASVGATRILVFDAPQVSVLCTGDELVPIDQKPSGAQIRNSNSHMMVALLDRLGCRVSDLGVVRDDPKTITDALKTGMKSDVLFVVGGMSMGEHDYVPGLMRELGMDLRITKLRMKPGKPFIFATHGDRFVFGLPGNPVSAFVCAVRLAARVLARLSGAPSAPSLVESELTEDVAANGPREFYQAAIRTGGKVRPLNWKGSADIYTLALANALIIRAENAPPRSAGKMVTVLDLDGLFGFAP